MMRHTRTLLRRLPIIAAACRRLPPAAVAMSRQLAISSPLPCPHYAADGFAAAIQFIAAFFVTYRIQCTNTAICAAVATPYAR